jgi:hypothetical protein
MIYFLQAGNNGPIKIGDSDAVHERLAELQVGCPYKLKLLFVYNGREFDEAGLHKKFKHENIRGEWFRPARSIVEFRKDFPGDCYPITNVDLYTCRVDSLNITMQKKIRGKI